jgi:hypothetical protein
VFRIALIGTFPKTEVIIVATGFNFWIEAFKISNSFESPSGFFQ